MHLRAVYELTQGGTVGKITYPAGHIVIVEVPDGARGQVVVSPEVREPIDPLKPMNAMNMKVTPAVVRDETDQECFDRNRAATEKKNSHLLLPGAVYRATINSADLPVGRVGRDKWRWDATLGKVVIAP